MKKEVIINVLLIFAFMNVVKWNLKVDLIWIPLITKNWMYFFFQLLIALCLFPI